MSPVRCLASLTSNTHTQGKQRRHVCFLPYNVLHLKQRRKCLCLLTGATAVPREPLARVDAPPIAELGRHMCVHPVPLSRDGSARRGGVRVHRLLPAPREVRLEGARYGEPFGVV